MKKLIFSALFTFTALFAAQAQSTTTPASANKDQAEITFDKITHDFGTVPQNVPASYTFTFKNTGKEPLIITNVAASCGCTQPEWTKEPIKKGEKGFIKATFNAASPGVFNKTVTVVSNAKSSPITLTLKGEVKTPTPPAQ